MTFEFCLKSWRPRNTKIYVCCPRPPHIRFEAGTHAAPVTWCEFAGVRALTAPARPHGMGFNHSCAPNSFSDESDTNVLRVYASNDGRRRYFDSRNKETTTLDASKIVHLTMG